MLSHVLQPVIQPVVNKLAVGLWQAFDDEGFNPTTLFADGSKGVLYDNNDLSSFYLDSAGTTPATVNGLVGLQLDKSQAQVVQRRNLLTYTEQFDNTTGWPTLTNVAVTANQTIAPDGTNTADLLLDNTTSGVHRLFRSATADSLQKTYSIYAKAATASWVQLNCYDGINAFGANFNLTTGIVGNKIAGTGVLLATIESVGSGWYRCSITIPTTFTGSPNIQVSLTNNTDTASINLSYVGTTTGVYIWGAQLESSTTISAYQKVVTGNGDWMAGNHRYQTTTGSKPVLRGTPTGLNLFASYGTPGSGWADSGSGVATATATTGSIPTNVVPANTRVYRVRYTATVTSGTVRLTLGGVNGATRSASGTYEEYIAATSTAALSFQGVTSFTGTVSALDVRDVTADSVTAPYGLQEDGFDDFMQTAAADFSATDKMTVCMGVRKLSDAARAIVAELGTVGATNGSFTLGAPNNAGLTNYAFGSQGTVAVNAITSTPSFAAPITNVVTGLGNISGDSAIIRVNGAQVEINIGDQGAGNYANLALYFGRRAGASLPFSGLDFGGIIVGKELTAAQLASVERWVAQRTGVTL